MGDDLVYKREPERAWLIKLLISASLFLLLTASSAGAEPPAVKRIDPPGMGFYSKEIDYQGIAIKAPAVVADQALSEAWRRLSMMLSHIPDAAANLREQGAELHIIGKDQGTTDLPEHRAQKGKLFDGPMTMDERTRGVGGIYASCGEENLLRLDKDRYKGRDICVHEFAHTLQEFGLDESLQKRIKDQYQRSIDKGLWKTAYAATNDHEFFAELSMWYFGTHGDLGQIQPPPVPGRDWLKTYDPDSYVLIDDIYSGRAHIDKLHYIELRAFPPANEGRVYSGNQQAKTIVLFINKSGQTMSTFWLDGHGERHFYADIPPSVRALQPTYVSHVWLVTRKDGPGVAIFEATPEPGKATIK